ncbi:chromate resistance protein ChrB domain-containing protein [Pseudonocardia sp. RS010]|uniref:chromate resistance protein ChrB domain-containing protein n=1 Tax=Pseudonocardia sp. RS010 TaxID=3385979 RepID=UPI0039A3A85A
MRWTTYDHVHLDRVATPWLILRFVDPAAEFDFVPFGSVPTLSEGTTAFGIPGVGIGAHDAAGTAFEKTVRYYELTDPVLDAVGRIVAAGVRHALGLPPAPAETAEESAIGATLDRLGSGAALHTPDLRNIEMSIPMYDALYLYCGIRDLPEQVLANAPQTPAARISYLRRFVGAPGRQT